MDIINQFSSDVNAIREAIRGYHGTEIYKDCKISYLGGIIIAEGDLETIKNKCVVPVYEFKSIGNNLYIGWIKN